MLPSAYHLSWLDATEKCMSFSFSISSRPWQRRRDLIGQELMAHFRQVPVAVMIGSNVNPSTESGISLTADWMPVNVDLISVQ
jgi:hypothetical protein